MSNGQLALQFLLQLAIILIACRAIGALMPRIGQPKVIGEIIAGILLGPSLLGLLAPSAQAALFPAESRGVLSAVSQIGLVLYMFVVGMHLHTNFIKQAYRGAMLISLAGVVAPFLLGAALASFLYADGRFFTASVSSWQSMMYLGAAMSVTAFPVLARIIQERGIGGTALGTLALAAGSVDDMIAWTLLGIVLTTIDSSFDLVRFVASHAVFVAFVVGALLPRGRLTEALSRRIEPVASRVLVPVFFALLRFVDASRAALVDRAAVAVNRRDSDRIGWKGHRVLGRCAAGRPRESGSAGDWRAHERPRADGAHHPQHRLAARTDHADAVHGDGA